MPRMEIQVRAETEVKIAPALLKKVKAQIVLLHEKQGAIKRAQEEYNTAKDTIETLFLDAGAEEELNEGLRVLTPIGEVPIKKIAEGTTRSLNKKKLMKKFKLTQRDLDSVTDEKPKKGYLGVYLPREKNDTEDDE